MTRKDLPKTGEPDSRRKLPEIKPNLEVAKDWLRMGTACGWSIAPILKADATVGFGIFYSEIFGKAMAGRKSIELAEEFAAKKECASLFKKLKINESSALKIVLKKVTGQVPLPCETVLKNELNGHWNQQKQCYNSSKMIERRLAAAAFNQSAFFPVLAFFSSEPFAIEGFLAGLKELDPGSITSDGLKKLTVFLDLWRELESSRSNGNSEFCTLEELEIIAESARQNWFEWYRTRAVLPALAGKNTRSLDDLYAQTVADAFGLTKKTQLEPAKKDKLSKRLAKRFAETNEDDDEGDIPNRFVMPSLSERELGRYAIFFGKMFAVVVEHSYNERIAFAFERGRKLSPLVCMKLGVYFVAELARKLSTKPEELQATELEAAFQNRKRSGSWAYLSSSYSLFECVPLCPVTLGDALSSTPALLRPELAVLRLPDQRKRLAKHPNPYLTCEDFLAGRMSFDYWESPAGRVVPLVAEQVLTGLLALVQAQPGVYQNFGFLISGLAQMPGCDEDHSEAFLNALAVRENLQNEFDCRNLKFGGFSSGYWVTDSSLFSLKPEREIEMLPIDTGQFPLLLSEVPKVDRSESKPVQLQLQFRPKNAGGLERVFESILKVFAASSSAVRAELLENKNEDDLFSIAELEYEPMFTFTVEGKILSEQDWLAAKKTKTGYVLPDGVVLPIKSYESCLDVYHHRQRALVRFGKLRLRDLWRASRLKAENLESSLLPEEYLGYLQTQLLGFGNEVDAQFVEKFSGLIEGKAPQTSQSELSKLRPYQKHGVGWVISRFALGLGACLADEMGLGKTAQALQVISLLHAKVLPLQKDQSVHAQNGKADVRSLVVCPKSLGLNWLREFSIWAPHLKVQFVEGQAIHSDTEVVVTTYARLRLRESEFTSAQWLCVVLDEAHNIKNHDTSQARTARNLQTEFRLALTGTPLENHPRELWSLLDWLNTGWLGDVSSFESYTRIARSKTEKNLMLAPLRSMIGPVLLRRLKSDSSVAINLPEKIERVVELELSQEQRALYEAVILTAIGAESGGIDISAFEKSSRYLKAILHAKQICNHPDNFLNGDEDDNLLESEAALPKELKKKIEREKKQSSRGRYGAQASAVRGDDTEKTRSSKMQALLELLLELKNSDGGILIFTQFKRSAQIICEAIEELALDHNISQWETVPYLGSTLSAAEREAVVAEFQNSAEQCSALAAQGAAEYETSCVPPILVLSLKTGGVGLNLTGATHVIHFDRWWNPAVEAQATDRAHRIGQRRNVTVTHFVALGTVEEGIAKMMDSKKALAHDFLAEASIESSQEFLRNESGFLSLVDPRGYFSKTQIALRSPNSNGSPAKKLNSGLYAPEVVK